jgi:hypothetical protein
LLIHNDLQYLQKARAMNEHDSLLRNLNRIILLLSVTASAGLAILIGQDSGFDLLNYHFYSGFALLHKPFGFDFAPAQIQSFHNPLLHVLSYLVLGHLSARAAAAAFGAIQGLNFYFIFRIGLVLVSEFRTSYRYLTALGCAVAGFYGICSTTELGATYDDNLISILILAGVLVVVQRLKAGEGSQKGAAAAFAVAGILAGAAFGLKFTAAVYLLGILVAVPLSLHRGSGRVRATVSLSCGLAAGFLATYGYWGIRLFAAYGNPFFPYLNKYFRSPYYEWSNFLDTRFFPRDWIQALFYPFFFAQRNHLVSEIGFRDLRIALCYGAIILLLCIGGVRLFRRSQDKERRDAAHLDLSGLLFLAVFFAISYIGWQFLSSIYRYLSVLELAAPIFLTLVIRRLIRKEVGVFWFSIGLNILIVAAAIPIDFGRQRFDDDLLKAVPPPITDLGKSTVLMTGYEPTAFIVPSFPEQTRFVRISSTFITPGRNVFLDGVIRKILGAAADRHLFAYVKSGEEMGLARLDAAFYGEQIDADSCYEIGPLGRHRGYLCAMKGNTSETNEKPAPKLGYFPKFENLTEIRVDTIRVYQDYKIAAFRISGMKSASVDILYTLNGELMPPVRRWAVSPLSDLSFGPLGRNGAYRVVGIRNSEAPNPDLWIAVDARVDIGQK